MVSISCQSLICPLKIAYIYLLCLHSGQSFSETSSTIDSFTSSDILNISKHSCLLLSLKSPLHVDEINLILQLQNIFSKDTQVTVGVVHKNDQNDIPFDSYSTDTEFILVEQIQEQRTCLLPPSLNTKTKALPYSGPVSLGPLVEFINAKCFAYRDVSGDLSAVGVNRHDVLQNLFTVNTISNTSIASLFNTLINPFETRYNHYGDNACDKESNDCTRDKVVTKYSENIQSKNDIALAQCPEVTSLSEEEFIEAYLKKSKPVIIRQAATSWLAKTKWSNSYLRSEYGDRQVHVKLTPGGDYEGIEEAKIWENFESFTNSVPKYVKDQLLYPDLVVVRPAGVEMKFHEFLDLIEKTATNEVWFKN